MIRVEDDCVGCDLPCIGKRCPYSSVKHLYCDYCNREVDTLYVVDGEELCADCVEDLFSDEQVKDSLEEIRYR